MNAGHAARPAGTATGEPGAPAAAPIPSTPTTGIRRVLIALDETAVAARAMDVGAQIAAAVGAEVALVYVVDPNLLVAADGGPAPDVMRAEYEREARSLLESAAGHLRTATPPWQFLEAGQPAREIVRVAGSWAADLIVVGTHGRSRIGRTFLGSTAHGVLEHAHRPVLIVPAAG